MTLPLLSTNGLVEMHGDTSSSSESISSLSSTPAEQVSGQSVPKFFTSNGGGVQIEVPDFDETFDKIQSVSPLARLAMTKTQNARQ